MGLTLNAEHDLYRWGPITHAPSLLDGDGGFPRTAADLWDHADLDEVYRECRAQLERAIYWGFDVSHLDAHLDAVALKPEFFDVFLELAEEFRLPLRLPDTNAQHLAGFPLRSLAAERGVVSPDRVVLTGAFGPTATRALAGATVSSSEGPETDSNIEARVAELVAGLEPGVTEVCLRPALDTPELRAGGTRLARAHGRPQTARWRSGSRQVRRRSRGQAPRLSRPSRAHAQRLTRPSRTAGARHGAVDQNSVISSVSTRSCLYSAEFVIGSIAMSFAMLPVTFTFPCMNAALASSSFFWMRMASS